MKLLADTTLTNSADLIDKLVAAGWCYHKEYVNTPRDAHKTKYIGVFRREIQNPKNKNFVTKKISVTKEQAKKGVTHYPLRGKR